MKIIIGYSSKWSNSFSDNITKKNIVPSMGAIQDSIKGEKVIIKEDDSFEDIMFKINKVYPNFKYNPISKNTVLGVLSRLLGEIRYLSDFINDEKEHIINKLKNKISFNLLDRELYNEIVRISTPEKEVQNNGAGLIKNSSKNNILLSENKYSKLIYSALQLNDLDLINLFLDKVETSKNVEELYVFFEDNNVSYQDEFEIFKFLKKYDDNVKSTSSFDKNFRNMLKSKIETNDEIEYYIKTIKRIGLINHNDEEFHLRPNFINMAGLLIYVCTKFIEKINEKSFIEGKIIEKKGNIKGIAEASGGLTIKDFYNGFSDKKTTADTPYFISGKFFDKKENKKINQGEFNIGVTKEDGVLEINIAISEEDAIQLKKQIDAVGVSTFQLGKKGLAYIKEISVYE